MDWSHVAADRLGLLVTVTTLSAAIEPNAAGPDVARSCAVTVADLVSLIPLLAAAYGVVMGAAALSLGWQLFRDRTTARSQRGVRVPPEDVTDPESGSVP